MSESSESQIRVKRFVMMPMDGTYDDVISLVVGSLMQASDSCAAKARVSEEHGYIASADRWDRSHQFIEMLTAALRDVYEGRAGGVLPIYNIPGPGEN